MINRHYDDESLIAMMGVPDASDDPHVPGCPDCAGRIESFGAIASMLAEAETWDMRELSEEPRAETVATLRAFASRMQREDEAAVSLVERLLAGPREVWTQSLRRHPECRTAGVVRRLLTLAYDAVVTMPPDAVEMTALATEIADHLDVQGTTLAQLRGSAWRDRAYALYYTSRFDEALAACDRADEAFAECIAGEWDQARVGIVRALVLRTFEKFDESRSYAANAGRVFGYFEDLERIASARIVETNVLTASGQVRLAYSILGNLEKQLRDTSLVETHGRVLANFGRCAAEVGEIPEALNAFEMASSIYAALGITTESLRVSWNVAEVLVRAGELDAGEARLELLMVEMAKLGLIVESATSALSLAEILLASDRFEHVEAICRKAMECFHRSGLGYSTRALTALSYLQEAARNRTAKVDLVRSVRQYISDLPKQPQFLFAPPPGDW